MSIPNKTVTIRDNDNPWYDNKIRRESRKRDRLKRKASKTNNNSLWTKYRKCRNHVNNMIKEAKSRYFKRLEQIDFRYNYQKQFWKIINHFMKGKASYQIPPLIRETDTCHTEFIYDDIENASLLNEYFTSISSFDNVPDSLPDFESRTSDVFDDIDISREDVRDAINTLKIDKACGIDGISNRLIKCTSKSIFKPLALLFNLSLSNSCFPNCWRERLTSYLYSKKEMLNLQATTDQSHCLVVLVS